MLSPYILMPPAHTDRRTCVSHREAAALLGGGRGEAASWSAGHCLGDLGWPWARMLRPQGPSEGAGRGGPADAFKLLVSWESIRVPVVLTSLKTLFSLIGCMK